MGIGETVDFGAVRSNTELADALGALIEELGRARQAGIIDANGEEDAASYLIQARREAHMPVPNKGAVLEHLESARERLEGYRSATGITDALASAAGTVAARF